MEVEVLPPSSQESLPIIAETCGKYRFLETIGRGAFGKCVFSCYRMLNYAE